MRALDRIADWGAPDASAAIVSRGGATEIAGPSDRTSRWASVGKLLVTYAILVAAEEGTVELDEPAGPPDSTLRHLLAHASGLAFDSATPLAKPGQRRIYGNTDLEFAAAHLAEKAEMPFEEYLRAAVLEPLGLTGELRGSPATEYHGPLTDLVRLARELLATTLIAPETLAEATTVQFPGLGGVLPGVGRFDPNDWGLGFEIRDGKAPHWTGRRNSPRTFGHFGGSGCFLWVDPDRDLALVCLTGREFGPWALEAWPRLSDAVLGG